MTAALDFAALPPEINSARMYTGAGAGPMLAAASAWNVLAAELRSTVLSYEAVLAALTGTGWFGPAATTMAAAAMPYVAWMSTTAAQAEQTATKAEAAAGAYEAALGATVPPALVAANRAQLTTLVATNVVGQNTAAIAATEAQYAEMWAQDAGAMYGYAAASAVATELSQFVEPPQATRAGGLIAQAAAITQQNALPELISLVPNALHGLSGSTAGTGVGEVTEVLLAGTAPSWWQNFLGSWGPNANIWNTVTSTGLFNPGATVGTLSSLFGASATSGVADAAEVSVPDAVGGTVEGGLRGLLAAGPGNAGIVGRLSVPSAWAAAAPPSGPLHSALGGTPMVAPPPVVAAGMPGMPLGNVGSQPFGRALPQYGFRPSFVARPPAAG